MNLLSLETRLATATVSPYGAQVMSFVPKGGQDALWQTREDFLEEAIAKGKALRGGIPLCWPWFRNHPTLVTAPSHGLGRLRTWDVVEHVSSPERATVVLECRLNGRLPEWPFPTLGRLTVILTDRLEVELTTTNLGTEPFVLTEALHTYIGVGDVTRCDVAGLEGIPFKHISSWTERPVLTAPLPIFEETEYLFRPVRDAMRLSDPAHNRMISVGITGCDEVAVWNPWIEKSVTLDMPADGYKGMLCLEAARAEGAVTVLPGMSHSLGTVISVAAES